MAHININSLRNKLDTPTNSASENINITMDFETKLYERLPHTLNHLKIFLNPNKLGKTLTVVDFFWST